MARRRRVHIPSSFVHVAHRCNHGEALLADPKVKALFLAALDEVAAALGYEVVYYCLQDNHLHLFLLTPPEIEGRTLSTFMHRLDSAFGHRLNAWKGWRGTAWQGRYRATGWFPRQRLWVIEILLWYAATNTARRTVHAVPAADWRWGALYWLLRGKRGRCGRPWQSGWRRSTGRGGAPTRWRPLRNSPTRRSGRSGWRACWRWSGRGGRGWGQPRGTSARWSSTT